MRKIYYLGTCSTCAAILKEAGILTGSNRSSFLMQDIKTEKITPRQLTEMKDLAGSFEALFSRRALKYKELGLKDKSLTENDYQRYILEEYTFLKRPVVIIDNKIFIGSEKKNVVALVKAIKSVVTGS